jgi:hypothetical protein
MYTANNYFIQAEAAMYSSNESADAKLANILAARKAEVELEKKLALVEQYGEDTFENGTILRFNKLFRKGGLAYEFAILKAAGSWYATGAINGWERGTWDGLVLSLVSGEYPVAPEEIIVMNDSKGSVFSNVDTSEDTNVITTRSTVVE